MSSADSKQAADPNLGRTVDGYRIDAVIGRGGMGVVYKANQMSLDRPVAIKVLPAELVERPQFLQRFQREVDVLSKLSHPNIVTVMERGELDGAPYLVMEYVEGTSLRDVIKKGPLPASEALVIVRNVLSALQHAHERGIIHRDIKPENVLVAPGGIVKVADFGLGRLLGPQEMTRLTHTELMLGTFEYMSPEQREKAKEADERTDIYGTGVVLYEMIAGELPIGAFEPLPDTRVDAVVRRSLDKSPAKRFQRASEMGEAVSRLLTSASSEPLPPPAKKKPKGMEIMVEAEGEMDLTAWVAIAASLAAVAWAAINEFDIGGTGWVLLAVGIAACTTLMPPFIRWANSMKWGCPYEIPVGRVVGKLPNKFAERVIEDPAAQIYVKEVAGAWASFPAGLEFEIEDERICAEFGRHRVHDPKVVQRIAAAIGEVLARASRGKIRRIATVDSTFESKLEGAPTVLLEDL